MPKYEGPRVGRDDVVHDDHERHPIVKAMRRGEAVWKVWTARHVFDVVRLPALDEGERQAWTPDEDAVKAAS